MKASRDTALTRRLGLRLPIVQGPFGGGLSSPDLVAAVCEAGGLGSFGLYHLDGEGILATARAIRERTAKPFNLNLWIPHEQSEDPPLTQADFERAVAQLRPFFDALSVPLPARSQRFMPPFSEQIEALLEARPAVFSFVYGVPEPAIIDRCRERGIATVGTATTVEEAQVLERGGVDMVVATGFEAGGHRVSFLRQPEDCLTGTLALVPQVVDAVAVPVIAAGGIADGRGVAAALSLGASGVQIGTAFLACAESGASQLHRDILFTPRARDTALTRAFTGRLARGVRNEMMHTLQDAALPPYPVQSWLAGQFKAAAAAQGRSDLMALWSGQAAGLLQHRRAAALMAALESAFDGL